MLITKIAEQKRRPNRRSVYLDGAFSFGCNLNVIARFRLREGMTITPEELQTILRGGVRQECFDGAMKFLQLRLHSRSELHRKLMRREYGHPIIEDVLDQLVQLGYLNDAQFAKTKALSASQYKHHGRRRAKIELMKSGIRGETAEKALDEVYSTSDSVAVARSLAEKQAPRLCKLDPAVARRRLTGMLLRRGFDYETIKPVVDAVLAPESSDASFETDE